MAETAKNKKQEMTRWSASRQPGSHPASLPGSQPASQPVSNRPGSQGQLGIHWKRLEKLEILKTPRKMDIHRIFFWKYWDIGTPKGNLCSLEKIEHIGNAQEQMETRWEHLENIGHIENPSGKLKIP